MPLPSVRLILAVVVIASIAITSSATGPCDNGFNCAKDCFQCTSLVLNGDGTQTVYLDYSSCKGSAISCAIQA